MVNIMSSSNYSMSIFIVNTDPVPLQSNKNRVYSAPSCASQPNIYILNVAALDETIILSCLHFSMQNIEQSRGQCRASKLCNVNVNQ